MISTTPTPNPAAGEQPWSPEWVHRCEHKANVPLHGGLRLCQSCNAVLDDTPLTVFRAFVVGDPRGHERAEFDVAARTPAEATDRACALAASDFGFSSIWAVTVTAAEMTR